MEFVGIFRKLQVSEADAWIVDLRSDTVTQPTATMRRVMSEAVVGDDVYGEDPTVNALEARVASLLGKEAALFVPSATMANLIAVMVHCDKRGAECIVGDKSHIFKYEQGGAAQVASVLLTTLKNNPDGTFDLDELKGRIRGDDIHEPRTTMVAVENTHNVCGGKVVPMAWLERLGTLAKETGLILHMDGARLFNACEYLSKQPDEIVRNFDSVSICFSKGLSAPAGSCVVGTEAFIKQARRARKVLGGGMRQAGVLAAAASVGLHEVWASGALGADHVRARLLADAVAALRSPAFGVEEPHTNMVMVRLPEDGVVGADEAVRALATPDASECAAPDGRAVVVKAINMGPRLVRLTTHHGLTDEDARLAAEKLKSAFAKLAAAGR